jgi:exopolyphosphatase/pppGpp-phosphohydrolase
VQALDSDALLPGAVALRVMLEHAGVEEALVSRAGLREGMIVDYIEKNRATDGLPLVEVGY